MPWEQYLFRLLELEDLTLVERLACFQSLAEADRRARRRRARRRVGEDDLCDSCSSNDDRLAGGADDVDDDDDYDAAAAPVAGVGSDRRPCAKPASTSKRIGSL